MKNFTSLFKNYFTTAFVSALACSTLTLSAHAEMPPFAVVKDVQIDGSGCQAGSANALMTSDLNFLSVLYDNFSAEIGKGTANPGMRAQEKNCTINVTIQIPAGWNFQFESINYNGFVTVPNRGALAYQIITAEVYGGRGVAFEQNLMKGPRTENYSILVKNAGTNGINSNSIGGKLGGLINIIGGLKNTVDKLGSGGGDLFGCSSQVQETKIKIKSIIGVRNLLADIAKPAVKIVVDSTDAAFRQNFKLSWKRCQ